MQTNASPLRAPVSGASSSAVSGAAPADSSRPGRTNRPDRTHRTHRAGVALGAILIGAWLLVSTPRAHAQDAAPATGLDAGLEQQVRDLAEGGTRVGAAGVSRVDVSIGQLDARLKLAPCQRIEPYLPNNTRLWGKTRIGLRCAQGTTLWNVYLPVTVKVYGRALVVPAGAAAGSVLSVADLSEAEVDLAEDFTPAVTDAALAIGRTLAQTLKPGQTLRQGQLKVRQYFAAGDTVRVIANGSGFTLESEGQALTNGLEGQTARVRTESGHVVTGQPIGERRLELVL